MTPPVKKKKSPLETPEEELLDQTQAKKGRSAQQDVMLAKLGSRPGGKNPKLNKLAGRLAARLKKAS